MSQAEMPHIALSSATTTHDVENAKGEHEPHVNIAHYKQKHQGTSLGAKTWTNTRHTIIESSKLTVSLAALDCWDTVISNIHHSLCGLRKKLDFLFVFFFAHCYVLRTPSVWWFLQAGHGLRSACGDRPGNEEETSFFGFGVSAEQLTTTRSFGTCSKQTTKRAWKLTV